MCKLLTVKIYYHYPNEGTSLTTLVLTNPLTSRHQLRANKN